VGELQQEIQIGAGILTGETLLAGRLTGPLHKTLPRCLSAKTCKPQPPESEQAMIVTQPILGLALPPWPCMSAWMKEELVVLVMVEVIRHTKLNWEKDLHSMSSKMEDYHLIYTS
jgi:hypothetical protein